MKYIFYVIINLLMIHAVSSFLFGGGSQCGCCNGGGGGCQPMSTCSSSCGGGGGYAAAGGGSYANSGPPAGYSTAPVPIGGSYTIGQKSLRDPEMCVCPAPPECPALKELRDEKVMLDHMMAIYSSADKEPYSQPKRGYHSEDYGYAPSIEPSLTMRERIAHELAHKQYKVEPSGYELDSKKSSTSSRSGYRFRAAAAKTVDSSNEHCTNPKLKRIIMQNVDESSRVLSKKRIAAAARDAFGVNYDVICSEFDFSFHISSTDYCETKVGDIICLIFKHDNR